MAVDPPMPFPWRMIRRSASEPLVTMIQDDERSDEEGVLVFPAKIRRPSPRMSTRRGRAKRGADARGQNLSSASSLAQGEHARRLDVRLDHLDALLDARDLL
eukprot:7767441-Pyramimonas_sp.AAC.1